MRVEYANQTVEKQCTSLKETKKLFGGNVQLAVSLQARINMLMQADTLHDIIVLPSYRFHNLVNKKRKKLDGYFAIDVKTKKESWRIILQPLNDELQPFESFNIDDIAKIVRVVEIKEVSDHYE